VLLLALLGCRDKAAAVGPPVIAISLEYPGASADVIEASTVQPIEHAVATIKDVRTIESRIEADRATVSIELAPAADVERASHDVRHALSETQAQLPREVLAPVMRLARRDDQPILWLSLGGALPVTEVSTYAREAVRPQLQRIAGVGEVELHGVAELAVIVRPDLDTLLAMGLPLFDVLATLQSIEVGQVDALRDVIVKEASGWTVRLRDVATVETGFEREPGAAAPSIAVRAQFDANRATVLRAVRESIAKLELPPGVTVAETKSPIVESPPAPLVVMLLGPSLDELQTITKAYVDRLKAAGVTDVVRDPPEGEREQAVVPDRDRAAQLGIPLPDIFATLRAVGSAHLGEAIIDGERRPIVLKLATTSLAAVLGKLYVRNQQGSLVPLSMVVSVKEAASQAILRVDHQRATRLSIYAPQALLAAAREAIADRALPAGYRAVILP